MMKPTPCIQNPKDKSSYSCANSSDNRKTILVQNIVGVILMATLFMRGIMGKMLRLVQATPASILTTKPVVPQEQVITTIDIAVALLDKLLIRS